MITRFIAALVASTQLSANVAMACRMASDESHVITAKPAAEVQEGELMLEVSVEERPDRFQRYADWQKIQATVIRPVVGEYRGRTIILETGRLSADAWIISSCTHLGATRGFVVGRLSHEPGREGILETRPRKWWSEQHGE